MLQLSVIIPAYNAGSSLEKCAHSILRNCDPDLELIIVNDGSTDDTEMICGRLAETDKRVKILCRENSGVSASRNAGIEAAAGEYIAFADADDSLEPGAYGRMLGALKESGAGCGVCGYYITTPGGNCKPRCAPFPDGFHDYSEIKEKLVLSLFADRVSRDLILGAVWRWLFKRSVIIENNIRFSGAYLEDEIFLIEYFSYPATVYSVNEPLYYYLQNPASVTKKFMPDFIAVFNASLAKKEELAERQISALPLYWRDNTLWAGLFIAVSNVFAPGNPKPFREKLKSLNEICELEYFRGAIKNYRPDKLSVKKAVVAGLIRKNRLLPLSILYALKNRNRGKRNDV